MASATRILDRAAARIEVAHHVSPLIIRDIVDEGTGLLGRVNQTLGGGGTPPAAHRALLLVFRHAVELADGFDELIEEGVITPAGLQVRAILEAHMQMLYLMGRRVQSPSANPIGKASDPVPRDTSGAPLHGTTLLDALNERGEAYLVLETRRQLATAQLYRAGPLTAWFAETTGKSAVPGKTVDRQIQRQLAAEENRLHAGRATWDQLGKHPRARGARWLERVSRRIAAARHRRPASCAPLLAAYHLLCRVAKLSTMPRCIYCSRECGLDRFSREHVIHRAFGGFHGSLTLAPRRNPAVCSDCNQAFGNTIDLAFTRDSYEAFRRMMAGDYSRAPIRRLLRRRLRFTLPESHALGPLHVEFDQAPDNSPAMLLVPQVRFQTLSGKFICVPEADLERRDPRAIADLNRDKVAIFSSSADAEERLKRRLAELGFILAEWKAVPDLPQRGRGEIDFDVAWAVDAIVARAAAKIGFNYLAFTMGAEFCLRPEFDPIRRFIRDGAGEWRTFVDVSQEPILVQDHPQVRHTRGHLLTVGWGAEVGGQLAGHLMAQVSLYNEVTYRIHLCRHFDGIWRDIASGHHYDLEARRVEPLGRTRLVQPAGFRPVLWS